jgi:hypothetical protein
LRVVHQDEEPFTMEASDASDPGGIHLEGSLPLFPFLQMS